MNDHRPTMGLDIDLYDSEGRHLLSINWLRNPFGLVQVVEDNLAALTQARKEAGTLTLHEVCNRWSYKRSSEIDRALFLETVQAYKLAFCALTPEEARLYFTFSNYRQFIQPYYEKLPKDFLWINGERTEPDGRLSLPLEYAKVLVTKTCDLAYYKKWIGDLHEIAQRLQDPSLNFIAKTRECMS